MSDLLVDTRKGQYSEVWEIFQVKVRITIVSRVTHSRV